MNELPVPEGSDSSEAYDRAHGTTSRAEVEKPTGLSEASNKAPPQDTPFKVTGGK